jgi:hypothetical protein
MLGIIPADRLNTIFILTSIHIWDKQLSPNQSFDSQHKEFVLNIQTIKKTYIALALAILVVIIVFVSQHSETPTEIENVENIDCESYFSKGASEESIRDEMYVSPKTIGFMSKNGQFGGILQMAYNNNSVVIVSKVISNTALCVKENALMGIQFEGNETLYMEPGSHKANCISGRFSANPDQMAMAIHKIPINSLMFKNLMQKNVFALGIDTNHDDFALFPLNPNHTDALKKVFTCAYLSVGKHIDLSDDSLLINNGHDKE